MDCLFLTSVWRLKAECNREKRRIEDLRFFAQPSSPPLDGMPHASAHTSKVENLATLIVDAERSLVTLGAQLEQQKCRLLSALNNAPLKELQQRVLSYRYVGCQSFNGIAKLLHYSRRYIIELHDEGLRALGVDVRAMINHRELLRSANNAVYRPNTDNQFTIGDVDNISANN